MLYNQLLTFVVLKAETAVVGVLIGVLLEK